jgi:hypothetical protein
MTCVESHPLGRSGYRIGRRLSLSCTCLEPYWAKTLDRHRSEQHRECEREYDFSGHVSSPVDTRSVAMLRHDSPLWYSVEVTLRGPARTNWRKIAERDLNGIARFSSRSADIGLTPGPCHTTCSSATVSAIGLPLQEDSRCASTASSPPSAS